MLADGLDRAVEHNTAVLITLIICGAVIACVCLMSMGGFFDRGPKKK